MKRKTKKLALNRDTVRSLSTAALGDAVGAGTYSCVICTFTCAFSCYACTGNCPTRVGNCTALC